MFCICELVTREWYTSRDADLELVMCNQAIIEIIEYVVCKVCVRNFIFHLRNESNLTLTLFSNLKFPRCDGSHTKHNKETGDNVGPLVLKRKKPQPAAATTPSS